MKKKIVILTAVLLVMFARMGYDEGVSPQLVFNSYAEVETKEATTEAVVEKGRTEFYIGEHVAIGDYVMVLNGFSFSKGQVWSEPAAGNQFVNFEITLYNCSSDLKSIDSLFVFELRDSDQKTYGAVRSKEDFPRLEGAILPGGYLKGIVAFEVPQNATLETLIFDYNLFSTGQVTFVLDENTGAFIDSTVFSNTLSAYSVKAMGDVLRFGETIYKVNGYRMSNGSADYASKEGYVYLIFNITVDNISNTNTTLDLDYTVQCENGYNYPLVFAPDLAGELHGDLPSGKSLTGEIAFEVPEGVACHLILMDNMETQLFYVVGDSVFN